MYVSNLIQRLITIGIFLALSGTIIEVTLVLMKGAANNQNHGGMMSLKQFNQRLLIGDKKRD